MYAVSPVMLAGEPHFKFDVVRVINGYNVERVARFDNIEDAITEADLLNERAA